MTTSLSKLASPTRQGSWGLTVDNHAHPAEVIVLRYPNEDRRDPAPADEVTRLLCEGVTPDLTRTLSCATGMPYGIALSLVTRLYRKLGSYRVSWL